MNFALSLFSFCINTFFLYKYPFTHVCFQLSAVALRSFACHCGCSHGSIGFTIDIALVDLSRFIFLDYEVQWCLFVNVKHLVKCFTGPRYG